MLIVEAPFKIHALQIFHGLGKPIQHENAPSNRTCKQDLSCLLLEPTLRFIYMFDLWAQFCSVLASPDQRKRRKLSCVLKAKGRKYIAKLHRNIWHVNEPLLDKGGNIPVFTLAIDFYGNCADLAELTRMPCLQSGESLINEKSSKHCQKVYPSANYAAMKARQRHLWINLGRVSPSYDVLG
jgi:hypothetical protein